MSTYPSTNPKKRGTAIKVSLTAQLHADLVTVATALGQPTATAASFAIGQWVAQQKRTLTAGEKAMEAVMDGVRPELVAQLKLMAGVKE